MSEQKYIKIEFDTLKLTGKIVKQTHRGYKFGKKDRFFQASNGILLKSDCYPDIFENTIYLRGSSKSGDDTILNFRTLKKLRDCISAVDEYNDYFGKEYKFSKELDKILDI